MQREKEMKKRDEKGTRKADTSTLLQYILYSAQNQRGRDETGRGQTDRLSDKQIGRG